MIISLSYRSVLGPREPLTLVLSEKDGLETGVEVAKGPLELLLPPKALPAEAEPLFKLADLLTGILLPASSKQAKIKHY